MPAKIMYFSINERKTVFLRHEKTAAAVPHLLQNRGFHPWWRLCHAVVGGESRRRPKEMDSLRRVLGHDCRGAVAARGFCGQHSPVCRTSRGGHVN